MNDQTFKHFTFVFFSFLSTSLCVFVFSGLILILIIIQIQQIEFFIFNTVYMEIQCKRDRRLFNRKNTAIALAFAQCINEPLT